MLRPLKRPLTTRHPQILRLRLYDTPFLIVRPCIGRSIRRPAPEPL